MMVKSNRKKNKKNTKGTLKILKRTKNKNNWQENLNPANSKETSTEREIEVKNIVAKNIKATSNTPNKKATKPSQNQHTYPLPNPNPYHYPTPYQVPVQKRFTQLDNQAPDYNYYYDQSWN